MIQGKITKARGGNIRKKHRRYLARFTQAQNAMAKKQQGREAEGNKNNISGNETKIKDKKRRARDIEKKNETKRTAQVLLTMWTLPAPLDSPLHSLKIFLTPAPPSYFL